MRDLQFSLIKPADLPRVNRYFCGGNPGDRQPQSFLAGGGGGVCPYHPTLLKWAVGGDRGACSYHGFPWSPFSAPLSWELGLFILLEGQLLLFSAGKAEWVTLTVRDETMPTPIPPLPLQLLLTRLLWKLPLATITPGTWAQDQLQ